MLTLIIHSLFFFLFLYYTRIEEFVKEEVDLTLSTSLEFNTPLADLSDVKTMMDSINVVPGLIYKPFPQLTLSVQHTDEGSFSCQYLPGCLWHIVLLDSLDQLALCFYTQGGRQCVNNR